MKNIIKGIICAAVLGIVSTQPVISQELPRHNTQNEQEKNINIGQKVNNLIEIIRKSYVDQDKVPSDEDLFELISKEIFNEIGDKHGVYMAPRFSEMFKKQMNPDNYVGVGIQVIPNPSKYSEQSLTIVSFFKDSMLPVAGIKIGDRIVGVGEPGEELFIPTKKEEIALLLDKIKGPEGTEVVLKIARSGRYHVVTVPRIKTRKNFVKLGELSDNKILPISISQFSQDLFSELMHALRDSDYLTGDFTSLEKIKLNSTKVSGVILDLRDNPGGALVSAIRVADMFLDEGKVIVSIDSLGEEDDVSYVSTKFNIFGNIPIAIMINEQSASASELITAAIDSHNENVIKIGRKSFGKGSVQRILPMGDDGSVIKLTIAEYFAGGDIKINNVGVHPHVRTEQQNYYGKTEQEKYLNKAIVRSHLDRKYDHMLNVSFTIVESFLKGEYNFKFIGRKRAIEQSKEVKTEFNCSELGLRGCTIEEDADDGSWTIGSVF